MHNGLPLQFMGCCLGVPIPEEYAAEGEMVESAIQQALEECGQKHIDGAEVTPFLLERIRELTGGKSLTSNINLVKNNAKVGALIAGSLASSK